MIVVGTIRSAVQLFQLDNKWQQKKSNIRNQKKELTAEEKQLQRFQEQAEEIRENNHYAQIDAKVKSGGTLTPEEKEYLRKKNPQALHDYEKVKREKKAFEEKLKSCRTKEEVEKVKFQKMGSFMAEANQVVHNPYIPKSKKVQLMGKLLAKVTNVAEAYYDFKKTSEYQHLSTEEEVREERQQEAEALADSIEMRKAEGMADGIEESEAEEISEKIPYDIEESEAGEILNNGESREAEGISHNRERKQAGGISDSKERKEAKGISHNREEKEAEGIHRKRRKSENRGTSDNQTFEYVQTEIKDFLKTANVGTGNMDILV